MTSVGLGGIVRPLPREPVEDETRTYGAVCGSQHYEAVCTLHPDAMALPPGWFHAEFMDTTGDGALSPMNFARGVQASLSQLGFVLVDVQLRPIDRAEFERLAAKGQAI